MTSKMHLLPFARSALYNSFLSKPWSQVLQKAVSVYVTNTRQSRPQYKHIGQVYILITDTLRTTVVTLSLSWSRAV